MSGWREHIPQEQMMNTVGMGLEAYVAPLVDWLREHQQLILPAIYLIAFAECLAVVSLLVPATALMAAISVFAGATGFNSFPLAMAATLGAGTGFWVSYWAGLWYGPRANSTWPFKQHPQYLARGHVFFERWGIMGVFFGHFFGPVRAVIALVAGMCRMPFIPFQMANWVASFVWGFGFFYGGGLIGQQAMRFVAP
jgi:membrane protein DedA with SNARE-associated domain